jgi:hypothetical protein
LPGPVGPSARARISASLIAKFRAPRPCDVCGRVTTVKRFGLGKYVADGSPRGKQKRHGSIDLCGACWKATRPQCVICGTTTLLQRYFMGTPVYRGPGERQRYKAAGAINLCARCHGVVAEPRRGKVGAQRLHETPRAMTA